MSPQSELTGCYRAHSQVLQNHRINVSRFFRPMKDVDDCSGIIIMQVSVCPISTYIAVFYPGVALLLRNVPVSCALQQAVCTLLLFLNR